MNVRAVIFDFGGVLCLHPTDKQLAEAAAYCGIPAREFIGLLWKYRRAYDRGQDPASYWRSVGEPAGVMFDDATVTGLVRREIDFWSRFDERVLAWVRQLRDAGLRTSILSNLPLPIGESLRATPGFLDHFDQVTFSCELGVLKPDREIYEYALRGLGVAPAEALFLDDRPENVEGARAIGLHAELFTTWEDFVQGHLWNTIGSATG